MRTRILNLAVVVLLTGVAVDALAQSRRPGSRPRRGQSLRHPDKLKVGDEAPDFTLKTKDGKRSVTLSEHFGEQPVALIFGSYT